MTREADGLIAAPVVHVASGTPFDLRLTALGNGAVRLRLEERGKARYSPPDVLLPEAEAGGSAWADIKALDKNSVLLQPPGADVTYRLQLDPLRLDMARARRAAARLRARGGCAALAAGAAGSVRRGQP